MITYAVSLSAVGGVFTPAVADAFRRSRIHQVEHNFLPYTQDGEQSRSCAAIAEQLLKEGVIRTASVHLPFYGGGKCWDLSAVDEERRRAAVANFQAVIRSRRALFGREATLHASLEPPPEEHPARLDQVCRSLEELLPLAQETGFRFNVEYLPRTCIGNCAEELEFIVSHFDPHQVGICLDVNHIMDRSRELPDLVARLAPRINAFHICDYDGVDELHWFAGQGCLDWPEIMKRIKAIDHDLILISETKCLLGNNVLDHAVDPYWALKQTEDSIWLLENAERVFPERRTFPIPGN